MNCLKGYRTVLSMEWSVKPWLGPDLSFRSGTTDKLVLTAVYEGSSDMLPLRTEVEQFLVISRIPGKFKSSKTVAVVICCSACVYEQGLPQYIR